MSNAITSGSVVKMSENLKRKFRGKCGEAGEHLGPFDPGGGTLEDPGGDCWGCSTQHVDEFGDCVGIVGESYFPNDPDDKHLEVKWQPSGLRYGYDPADLVLVQNA